MIKFRKISVILILIVFQSIGFAGTLTVNSGATLRGTGVITGDLDVQAGGTVAPFITCLTVSNAIFLNGSNLQMELSGTNACTNQSQLIVNGTIDVNGANLNTTVVNYTLQDFDTFLLINNDQNEAILNEFNSLPEGGLHEAEGNHYYASYVAGDGNDFSLQHKTQYTIAGQVNGLAIGNSVQLQLNNNEIIEPNSNGAFQFNSMLESNDFYDVVVITQPTNPNQFCSVTNGSGAINGANIVDIVVDCVNTYTLGGSITGLQTGTSLTINNGADQLVLTMNGPFTFNQEVAFDSPYQVEVNLQPINPNQTCMISNHSGTMPMENVTNVAIECIVNSYFVGGDLTGLVTNNSVILQNNTTDDLMLMANGPFVFDTALADHLAYEVSVLNQPTTPNQNCVVNNPGGFINGDDVIDVSVNCTIIEYTIGGTLTGLLPGEMLVLQNNTTDDLALTSNGAFTFSQKIEDEQSYDVTVLSEPVSPIQNCAVQFGSGTVSGAAVTDIEVDCDNLDLIFKNGFE